MGTNCVVALSSHGYSETGPPELEFLSALLFVVPLMKTSVGHCRLLWSPPPCASEELQGDEGRQRELGVILLQIFLAVLNW